LVETSIRQLVTNGTDAVGLLAASLVVVEIDVVGNAGMKFFVGGEGVTVEVLVLEDRPEALGAGVVVT
jgi:hypothetical protein